MIATYSPRSMLIERPRQRVDLLVAHDVGLPQVVAS
jgi:hypothetical protein